MFLSFPSAGRRQPAESKPIGNSGIYRRRHRCLSHHRETMTTPGKTISPHCGKTLPPPPVEQTLKQNSRSGTCAVRPSSAMILRSTFSETRVRSAALTLRYPYLPPGGGECLGRPDARPGISVNPEPGAVAVGSCLARRRASMSSSRVNTPASDGRPEASSPCPVFRQVGVSCWGW